MVNNPVTVLRKQGQLEQALLLANQNLNNNPQDMEAKFSLAWVYYDYLKLHALTGDFTSFVEVLKQLKSLEIHTTNNLLCDSLPWPIHSLISFCLQNKQWNFICANELFLLIKDIEFTRPSETFSILIKALNQGFQNYNNFIEVINWCGLDNFEAQDYIEPFVNGRKYLSLVEQIYINYAKNLLSLSQQVPKEKYTSDLQEFLHKLEELIQAHPNYVYPCFYKAKILLELGKKNQALMAFLPFARLKRRNYWVWEFLAQIYSDNGPYAFSCYCKALSLGTKDEFLIKVRLGFCELLVESKMYVEARTEIQNIVQSSQQMNYNIPNSVLQWQQQPWYEMVRANDDNHILYKRYRSIAEGLLYSDIEPWVVVVEFVHSDKKIIHFVKNKQNRGFFKYQGFIKQPKVGELLSVRLQKEGDNGFYIVLTLDKAKEQQSEALKTGSGIIHVLPEGIGFIGDVYFEKDLIEQNAISNQSTVNYKAFLIFNKKRKQWGWKAFEVSVDK
ncbi:tetratricopeptide repeat protein [Myroides sp. LJL119]